KRLESALRCNHLATHRPTVRQDWGLFQSSASAMQCCCYSARCCLALAQPNTSRTKVTMWPVTRPAAEARCPRISKASVLQHRPRQLQSPCAKTWSSLGISPFVVDCGAGLARQKRKMMIQALRRRWARIAIQSVDLVHLCNEQVRVFLFGFSAGDS